MGFDEPKPFVDATGDLCEKVGGPGVVEIRHLVDRIADTITKRGERIRNRRDMGRSLGDFGGILLQD